MSPWFYRQPTVDVGTFIIRFASGVNGSYPGQLAISYRKENNVIQHILVDFERLDKPKNNNHHHHQHNNNNNNVSNKNNNVSSKNNNDSEQIYGPSFLLDGEYLTISSLTFPAYP